MSSKKSTRRFPPPWTIEQIPGGYPTQLAKPSLTSTVASGDADTAKVLTIGDARLIASNIASLTTRKQKR